MTANLSSSKQSSAQRYKILVDRNVVATSRFQSLAILRAKLLGLTQCLALVEVHDKVEGRSLYCKYWTISPSYF